MPITISFPVLAGASQTTADVTANAINLTQQYAIPGVKAVLVLLIAFFAAKLIARLASLPICQRVDETLGRFVSKLIFYAIMTFAVLGVLGMFGVSVASFAAVVAAAGFAVGLAFQGSLSNFAAGVLLLVFRPFKVGDVICAAGITATVTEIDLFHTVFDTFDNRRVIVPNSVISSGTIENISHHGQRRVGISVSIEISADIDHSREVLLAAAASLSDQYLIDSEGRGCSAAVSGLGDRSVNWNVRFWTASSNFGTVKEQLAIAIKQHLEQAGIQIAVQRMDVRIDNSE